MRNKTSHSCEVLSCEVTHFINKLMLINKMKESGNILCEELKGPLQPYSNISQL